MKRFPRLAVEDEGRLKDLKLREHFLIRIFAFARLRETVSQGTMSALISFHSENKLLLMAYNRTVLRELDRLAANPGNKPVVEVISAYEQAFGKVFIKISSRASNINVLMHTLGYFHGKLSGEEKSFVLDAIVRYREGKLPLSAVVNVMQSWITHYQERYLMNQTYFSPYPEKLAEVADSGKGMSCSKT